MKKIIFFVGLIFLSCNGNIEELPIEKVDSVYIESQKNLLESESISKKSDSVTKNQVVKIVKEIKYLTTEVEKYKTEKILMLNELKLSQENVKVRIDTVYIETKRNFWGKEKTTTSVKSDSTITSTIDSVLEKTEKIDTISQFN